MKPCLSFLLASILAMVIQARTTLEADPNEVFEDWLFGLESEALEAGIRRDLLEDVLPDIELIPRVIELDRNQPEGRLSFAEYLTKVVPKSRVDAGKRFMEENRTLLAEVESDYLVQLRFVVALWGIESDFGRFTGGFSVINSLATLAYDGRRSSFFRSELINALKILNLGEITNEEMLGSWAGAMGQCQFMPSSFHSFAEDYDNDGKRDIWNSQADVFASIANYLHQSGWRFDQTWGRKVRLPQGFDTSAIGLKEIRPIGEWQKMGIRRNDGGELPGRQLAAAIVLPDGDGSTAYMVYDNFRNIMKWNRSVYFALAVGTLSDQLGK